MTATSSDLSSENPFRIFLLTAIETSGYSLTFSATAKPSYNITFADYATGTAVASYLAALLSGRLLSLKLLSAASIQFASHRRLATPRLACHLVRTTHRFNPESASQPSQDYNTIFAVCVQLASA
ncbi:hypothetical protein WJ968_16095 [Achromobacter xylosoxidans]